MTTAGAQHIIQCNRCDETVEFFCNHCKVRLCGKCVAKHLSEGAQGSHNIVSFYKRNPEIINHERLYCKTHKKGECVLYCRTCSMPICGSCILDSHRKHNFEDIDKIVYEKSKKIWKDIDMLTNLIQPVLEEILGKTIDDMTEKADLYDELRQEIIQTRTDWRNAVDEIIQRFLEELNDMQVKHFNRLQQQSMDMSEALKGVENKRRKNTEILKSNESIITFESDIDKIAVVPATVNFSMPKFVQGSNQQIGVGRLEGFAEKMNASYVIKPKPFILNSEFLVNTIASGSSHVSDLACVSDGSTWICQALCGDLMNLGVNGKLLTTLNIQNKPFYISVLKNNQILFSSVKENTVIKIEDGNMSSLIKTENWEPRGLTCTMSNEILLCQRSVNHGKFVKYGGDGIPQFSIEFDSESKPLLHDPTYIAENRNGDICISDLGQNCVVVFDRKGKNIFSYNGNIGSTRLTTVLSGVYGSFYPHGIATDALGNILIADHDNDVVHMIDQWGAFVQYLMAGRLSRPCVLSISSDGHLWVGSEKGKIKVIKYKT